MRNRLLVLGALFAAATISVVSCSDPCAAEHLSPLAKDGCRIYHLRCIKCHNVNPALEGMPGPAVAKSSRELLEEKILRDRYPSGYQPKKPQSDQMRLEPLKDLTAENLAALAAYLNELK
jgi:mono/diheme cytochrome c family protein